MNLNKNTFVFILTLAFNFCAKQDRSCDCPIGYSTDRHISKGKSMEKDSLTLPNINIDAQVNKILNLKSNIKTSYEKSTLNVQEIYQEILSSNPSVTQRVNVYREISCSYYRFICGDGTLTESEKKTKQEKILDEYRANVYNFLLEKDTMERTKTVKYQDNISRKRTKLKVYEPKNMKIELLYASRLTDPKGNSILGASIYCSNCITEKVTTNENGEFFLKATFSEQESHWLSMINIHMGEKRDSRQINWREKSPESITF